MLLGFRIANHRSIKAEQDFDLRPVYRKNETSIRVAAVYGPNASGKSNILNGLRFMHDAVTEQSAEWRGTEGVPQQPFMLDAESPESPSSYAVDLVAGGIKYSYGFSIDRMRVTEEWLYSYPSGRKQLLFERTGAKFKFGRAFGSPRVRLLDELTPDNGLFLSYAARAKIEEPRTVFDWFHRSLWFASDERANISQMRHRTMEMLAAPETSERIRRLIRAADFGILGVERETPAISIERVDSKDLDGDAARLTLEPGGAVKVLHSGERVPPDLLLQIHNLQSLNKSVLFEHSGVRNAKFPLEQESRGTRAWFEAAGYLIGALENGWTLVVDELDTSLHPVLLAHMVKLFQDPDANPRGAQLVFTTHDTSLLGRHGGDELLRRDEIWFMEKNGNGESALFPLTDFKPRDGLNWERRYLGGAVGAIPYVTSSGMIDAVARGEGDS
ncbi:ATP-binding protein [Kitasatospora sp. YST-16]|uniref:AAA family ATPase n=1 Tax=Kitasatospora sp. YST-16 TaxID=2998080 RepID=UPI002284D4CF|nr:ATP-binding protein [Kitasatospora sp. YST-16]WAL72084.1 ATP-binding protein [Kitasatospora sp. YST-16]WNW38126.1 ATP-binding protein [Streptomyces sp. Li-HN-5-13]